MNVLQSTPGGVKPKLYHAPSSYFSMIARLALTEGGIDHEQVFVDILFRGSQQLPSYARLNPHMTVPTLVLPGCVIDQSRDILNVALPGLARGLDTEVTSWIDLHYSYPIEELTFGGFLANNALARFIVPNKIAATRRRLLRLAANHPDLATVYKERAAVFAERERTFDPKSAVQLAATRRKEAIELLDRLERHFGDGRNVMVPPDYTTADVVWTVFLARIEFAGMEKEIVRRPAVTRYRQAMKARPSFTAADIWTSLHVGRVIWGIVRNQAA